MLAAVRDARQLKFYESLLGIVETSLCSGAVYFTCIPDFTVSITDVNLIDVLTLNIQTKGYQMKSGSKNINITYRLYVKLMHTMSPGAKIHNNKKFTEFMYVNPSKAHLQLPQLVEWDKLLYQIIGY